MIAATGRSFLFLQGPPGPFFSQLAQGLMAKGHVCRRVNFNGGDWLGWRLGGKDDFIAGHADWPDYLSALIDRRAITDIILFGDCRPLHRAARAIAAMRGVVVHVFEEGYIRPDWVTLERGGVNGHSDLPRNPAEYLRLAADLPPVSVFPPVPAEFGRRAIETIAYFLTAWALTPRFRHYRSHRPHRSIAEAAGWLRRLALRPLAVRRSAAAIRAIGTSPYFVVPLQLDSDHQIRTHSPFEGMAEVIEVIVASFARHAPDNVMLVVKQHPLDNGLRHWRRIVRATARRHHIDRRVLFVEQGDVEALVVQAAGVVTVNSTTGTLALASGTPVFVLGRAVYDLPGVTHQGDLASFWATPDLPQIEIYEAFRRVLVGRCLLRGGFSSRAGRALLLPAALERLSDSVATIPVDTAAVRPRAAG
jgi:capsular polysaccharide export protein